MTEERRPSNSHRARDGREVEKAEQQKVVSGNVTTRKKSGGKQFLDRFVENDAQTIGSYLVDEIIIPTLKDLFSNMVNNSVDMFLYGETGRTNSSRRRTNSHTSYSDYYRSGGRDRQAAGRRAEVRRPTVDDIIFDSRVDAEEVLDTLLNDIDEYGCVSVADFYSAAGISNQWTDNKYGWYSLSNASVVAVRDGYSIRLPRPQPID